MTQPPIPSPSNDDANEDITFHASVTSAWHDCLEWAQRGDFQPLASMLRSETTLQDDWHIRNFLADVLDNKFKRSKGKPVRRPERKWGRDASGEIAMIDERDERRFAIMNFVRDHKASLGDGVYEAAAKEYGIDAESVRIMVRRSSKTWKRSRSA